MQQSYTLNKGEKLFVAGRPLKSFFAIRTGSIKTFITTSDGDERVIGLHMPGELLGFDALAHNRYGTTAVAIESSIVCEIPHKNLHELCIREPRIAEHFMILMSSVIADEHKVMAMLGHKKAESRIATLLLNVSSQLHACGYSASEFNLAMSRGDLGSYLRLALETISRILTHLQDEEIIRVNRKNITILDIERLREIADASDTDITYIKKIVD